MLVLYIRTDHMIMTVYKDQVTFATNHMTSVCIDVIFHMM